MHLTPVIRLFVMACALVTVALALAAGIWLLLRHKAYRRYIKYSPSQNAVTGFPRSSMEIVELRSTAEGFIMPEAAPGAVSGLIEVELRASMTGRFCDPWIELSAGDFRDIQFLERGVRGVRFLNISRLLAAGVAAGDLVTWRGEHLSIQPESASLHLSRDTISAEERVLVISPHPDDAEIAAFGLYSTTRSTLVNITAGDASNSYRSQGRLAMNLPRAKVARLRVWDSITVPQLGGVGPERALNLCYPDGQLSEMRLHPARDFNDDGTLDFPGLRRLNVSPLMSESSECSWNSLVRDLAHILAETRPTVIVTPHPVLDSHADHLAATAAVCEALRDSGLTDGRFLFTCVHNIRSELWPFGPACSGVAMLPIFESDGICADGFYSHSLTLAQQTDKYIALEAMHDMRNMEWPIASPTEGAFKRVLAELRAMAHGLGRFPASYFRRAVRPDEMFLTSSFTSGLALCGHLTS